MLLSFFDVQVLGSVNLGYMFMKAPEGPSRTTKVFDLKNPPETPHARDCSKLLWTGPVFMLGGVLLVEAAKLLVPYLKDVNEVRAATLTILILDLTAGIVLVIAGGFLNSWSFQKTKDIDCDNLFQDGVAEWDKAEKALCEETKEKMFAITMTFISGVSF